ncbi:catalase [Anaeromyxobacter terrae]|uniref:catalase n=1 Tax=Anaeromyxobacter terrae TaxID=2925406 RepID=UPI001F5AA120|nr:catalase [Anaeromyxobacter sp. SG22]
MPAKTKKPALPPKKSPAKASARSTVGGSRRGASAASADDLLAAKLAAADALAAAMPFNPNKKAEHGALARNPPEGAHAAPTDATATGSTLSETVSSSKVGRGRPQERLGVNPGNLPLDRVRVDSSGQGLTTNQGVPIADDQSSLKAGLRGPTLMEDFILREKITHFDHERIPERIVHARGSAAHGFFECTEALAGVTRASFLSEKGKRTPVFARFSTVAGERGSPDLVRDVRGFAVKFYTDEGNFDLVGNNMPVFFIQDAIKFPDLVHAVKPEPHHAMPQASSAHDTFWDFVSLMPESTHMLLWLMSDRALPRSFSMMQGFGVHTFRFVNAKGESRFVKFHWNPVRGTHSLDWDECVKINGADPDYHRRDLWESIEAGQFPEWELGVQLFTEEQADRFSFDVLDPTKIVPEELVPVRPVGRLVLNRNPDNFFAETEQVAFCAAHVVPGIDFSNDPLLAGRIHSYVDTQISRLGGPNFHEIPINAPVAQVHNDQRDGMHRQAIHRGRVAYEPNSLAGGCPFQLGAAAGFTSFPDPSPEDKVRGKPEKFADHYTQATLFWESQSEVEQAHIVRAFRFELTKVQTPAVRRRVVAQLANVSDVLARAVADGLGLEVPEPLPLAGRVVRPEVKQSPALSLFARPGRGDVGGRKIAILVAAGVDGEGALAVHRALTEAGAVPRLVAARLGPVESATGDALEPDATLETMPSCLFDAVVVPDGEASAAALSSLGHAVEFVKDQYRHCKTILAVGAGQTLLEKASLPLDAGDPALIVVPAGKVGPGTKAFLAGLAKHRNWDRAMDPPPV